VPHKIGDETSGDKSCTLVENNIDIKVHENKYIVLGNTNFHNLKPFFEKWQLEKVVGFRVMRVKLLLQKQHLKQKKCYT
jgi:hypothetical protein